MRYPLVAFLFVFVLGPYTAHALLTGSARFEVEADMTTRQLGSRATETVESRRLAGGVLVSRSASMRVLGD